MHNNVSVLNATEFILKNDLNGKFYVMYIYNNKKSSTSHIKRGPCQEELDNCVSTSAHHQNFLNQGRRMIKGCLSSGSIL